MQLNKFFKIVFLGCFFFGLGRIIEQGLSAQWDFGVYYAAARAFQKNLSPYLHSNLNLAWPERPSELPFVYPPITLGVFSLLAIWPAKVSVLLWGFLKALALVAWAIVIKKSNLLKEQLLSASTVFIFTVAFQSPIFLDFKAGNISVFEALTLWGSVVALLNSNFLLFSVLIAVLAQFKILTAAFALLPLFVFRKSQIKATVSTLLLTAALASLNLVFFHSWVMDFFHNQTPLSEHGVSNPLSYAFSQALFGSLNGLISTRLWDLIGWISICGFWVYRLLLVSKKETLTLAQKVCFSILVYGLCVPRFKDYSYTLLLPAAAVALAELTALINIEEILILFLFLFYPAAVDLIPRTWFSRAFTEYHPYIGLTLLSYFWSRALLADRAKKLTVETT